MIQQVSFIHMHNDYHVCSQLTPFNTQLEVEYILEDYITVISTHNKVCMPEIMS